MHSLNLQYHRINIVLFSLLILFLITVAPDRQWAKAPAVAQCPLITINPSTLPDGFVGKAYSSSLSASGGQRPYKYSLLLGSLPPGLTLSPTGSISGTPTTTNSYNIIVRVRDVNNCFGIHAYTIAVTCPLITVNPATLPAAHIGVFYSQTFSASGGTAPYSFGTNISALPPGLTWNTNGTLSGTPTQVGSYPFLVGVYDANNCFGERGYTLAVTCPTIRVAPDIIPGRVNQAVYSQLYATGGTRPYLFSLVSSTMPDGLTLSSDGFVSGIPRYAGELNRRVRVQDANGCIVEKDIRLSILPACTSIALNPTSMPVGVVGYSYSQPISATGGTAPYTFSLYPPEDDIPPGLSLASNGNLTGTPTTAGVYSFIALATDATGCYGAYYYHLTINSCPLINVIPSAPDLPNARINTPYGLIFWATGSALPYAFSLGAESSLPAGLTLSSDGWLLGTPEVTGNFSFTIVATDANGCSGFRLYNLFIDPCPLITVNPASPNLPNAMISTPYNATFSATGGAAPVTFSLSSGVLPLGLTIDPATGVLSGSPTQAGTFTFDIRATDANGCAGFRSYTLIVSPTCPAITVNPAALSSGAVGSAYNQTISATGGASPHSYSLSAGALPAGLTLNATTGEIAGAPTSAGPADFTVRVTDANGCAGERAFSIVIASNLVTSVSAASFAANTPLALESMVAAFGANMATSTEVSTRLPLPTELAGASLKIKDAAGVERLAPLFFVSPGQINYQIPPGTTVGPAHVTVMNGAVVTAEGAAEIATVSPGMFTPDGRGHGGAAAYLLRLKAGGAPSYEPVTQYNAAQRRFVAASIDLGPATDQVFLVLFGTGFKYRSGLSAVSCSIGGETIEALYAGEAPGFVGLDQLNVPLPRTLAGRGDLDVVISVDGKTANTVRVAIR